MVKIPDPRQRTAAAIFARHERDQKDWRREHLGASLIGESCTRSLWYTFRWTTNPAFPGRLLRLFERGQREEYWIVEELTQMGCTVESVDPSTGQQYEVSFLGGHFSGSGDGKITGVLEAPKTEHLLEVKTSNDRRFKELQKKGVKAAQPKHHDQMQVYMHGMKLTRAFYICVNKNDDLIYTERVSYDRSAAEAIVAKAARVISASEPLTRISEDPSWFECQYCNHRPVCHLEQVSQLERNCRTCASATAKQGGGWFCVYHGSDLDMDLQRRGCEAHLFIPALVPWEPIAADEVRRIVTYRRPDGSVVADHQKQFVEDAAP